MFILAILSVFAIYTAVFGSLKLIGSARKGALRKVNKIKPLLTVLPDEVCLSKSCPSRILPSPKSVRVAYFRQGCSILVAILCTFGAGAFWATRIASAQSYQRQQQGRDPNYIDQFKVDEDIRSQILALTLKQNFLIQRMDELEAMAKDSHDAVIQMRTIGLVIMILGAVIAGLREMFGKSPRLRSIAGRE